MSGSWFQRLSQQTRGVLRSDSDDSPKRGPPRKKRGSDFIEPARTQSLIFKTRGSHPYPPEWTSTSILEPGSPPAESVPFGRVCSSSQPVPTLAAH